MCFRITVARLIAVLAALAAVTSAAGKTDPCAPLTEKQIRKNHGVAMDAAKYATYAILSDNAYPRENPIPLPRGWAKVQEKDLPETGLALAVYERHNGNDLAEVVVAFRGTNEKKDWIQNLIPFFRIQVPPAEKEFAEILERYNGRGAKIVATGHSLGGGLAFHMSYIHPNVEAVAFNSSPVTKAGLQVHENQRTSVWESGEALQAPRNAVNVARVRWHGVNRVEVRFLQGSPIVQHRMGELALNLTKLAALDSQEFRAVLDAFCQGKPDAPASR